MLNLSNRNKLKQMKTKLMANMLYILYIANYELIQDLFIWVLLILIYPGLVPQPEPYFDLTPIKVTHTKIVC